MIKLLSLSFLFLQVSCIHCFSHDVIDPDVRGYYRVDYVPPGDHLNVRGSPGVSGKISGTVENGFPLMANGITVKIGSTTWYEVGWGISWNHGNAELSLASVPTELLLDYSESDIRDSQSFGRHNILPFSNKTDSTAVQLIYMTASCSGALPTDKPRHGSALLVVDGSEIYHGCCSPTHDAIGE